MNPPFLATISIIMLALCPLHVISILPPPHHQRPQQTPTPQKLGGKKSPPSKGHNPQDKARPPPSAPHKQEHAVPSPHGQANHLIRPPPIAGFKPGKPPPLAGFKPGKPPPLAGFKPGKPPPQSKANPGKKVGMLFLGFAGSLQVAIVGFLGYKRWQISKINEGEFAP